MLVDTCLGEVESDGTFVYRTVSPCVVGPPAVKSTLCSDCAVDFKG
jgi:hypothetical protein